MVKTKTFNFIVLLSLFATIVFTSCGKDDDEESYSFETESATRSVSKTFTKNGKSIIASVSMVRLNGKNKITYKETSAETGGVLDEWTKENATDVEALLIGSWRLVSTIAYEKDGSDNYSYECDSKNYNNLFYFGKYFVQEIYEDGVLINFDGDEYVVEGKKVFISDDEYRIEKLDDKNYELVYEDEDEYQRWVFTRK